MLPVIGNTIHIRVGGDLDNPLMAVFNVIRVDADRDIYYLQLMEVKPVKKED